MFDGVDAEVGFEVEVHVEQFGRVAGLLGDEREHRGGDAVVGGPAGAAAAGSGAAAAGAGRAAAGARAAGCGLGGAVVDEADDVVEGGVVAELEGVVAFDAVDLADGGEQFGLFDGVDAEVGFEVEVHVEQFGRVAGLFGDEREHPGGDAVVGGLAPALRSTGSGAAAAGAGSGAAAAGVVWGVRSWTKPTTWLRVG